MKKALVLVMMLALVVSVVSAGSVYLDTGVSFSNGSRRYETNKDLEYDLSVTSLPVEVGYRHVLDNNILISGSISEYFTLSQKVEDTVIEEDKFPSSTVVKVESGYRMEINKDMYAEFLGGFSYAFSSETIESFKAKVSYSTVSLVGEAGISYEITDSVFLRAGAKLAFPFATNYKTTLTVGSTTTEDKSKMTGFMFNITPFIGASYQF